MKGLCFMKTKIIYISGNEIFDMADIRAAFDEVRAALNLDKNTVLFGVPVEEDDAGLVQPKTDEAPVVEPIVASVSDTPDDVVVEQVAVTESVVEPDVVDKIEKKRGRIKKKTEPDPVVENIENVEQNEKVVPILSILSTNESKDDVTTDPEPTDENIEIITDITQETEIEETADDSIENVEDTTPESNEPDLEKLLSEMEPLNEDVLDEPEMMNDEEPTDEEPENIDATLEKLATEFVQTQDKIASENKSGGRSKIGKLRNILPFKQSKHHDQGLGDLFGWAGVAANDEEFSVPGFFTTASSKK